MEQQLYQERNAYHGSIPHARRCIYSRVLGNLWQFSDEDLHKKPLQQFVTKQEQQRLLRLLDLHELTIERVMAEASEMVAYWQEPGVDEITLKQFEVLLHRIVN